MNHSEWLSVLCIGLTLSLCSVVYGGEGDPSLLRPGIHLDLGCGYNHVLGDLTTVWKDGGSLMIGLGYKPWPSLGIEAAGDLGYGGMTTKMKNSVHVYDPTTETYGDRRSSGGVYYGWSFGPRYFHRISRSRFIASAGAGSHYYGQQESGIDQVKGYSNRWTYGWGYYGAAAVHRVVDTGRIPVRIGIQIRYTSVHAKVNDFYYDRYYGAESYDAIPATHVQDRRVTVAVSAAFGS